MVFAGGRGGEQIQIQNTTTNTNNKFKYKILHLWLSQVDEEKKVEAVRDFYENLGSLDIVDKLQLVSK